MTEAYHQRFLRYTPWSGVLGADYAWVTWVGSKVRHTFDKEYVNAGRDRVVNANYPNLDEEYFEWLDLVDSIENARDKFVMIELGAGYGRWIVSAANFIKRYRPELRPVLVGVEAEQTHFAWMKQHIDDNQLDPAWFVLHHAAVGARDGLGFFDMRMPLESYGQSLVFATKRRMILLRKILYRLGIVRKPLPPDVTGLATVPVLSLETLLSGLNRVDLLDLDIQGSELDVLTAARKALDESVVRVHIGTHSPEIEAGLRELFNGMGWRSLHAYPYQSKTMTPWGTVSFGDGVQSWINPRLTMENRPE